MSGWISVRDWRRFQHYDPAKRQPPWIKNYTELLDDEDYLALTPRLRGILHGIWLAYAAARCQLGSSPARIGLRIGDPSVRARDLAALSDAGFIDIVASKTLADGYHDASARAHAPETETEEEEELPPSLPRQRQNGREGGNETTDTDFTRLDPLEQLAAIADDIPL